MRFIVVLGALLGFSSAAKQAPVPVDVRVKGIEGSVGSGYISDGTTFVPLRAILESFGCQVEKVESTIWITKPEPPAPEEPAPAVPAPEEPVGTMRVPIPKAICTTPLAHYGKVRLMIEGMTDEGILIGLTRERVRAAVVETLASENCGVTVVDDPTTETYLYVNINLGPLASAGKRDGVFGNISVEAERKTLDQNLQGQIYVASTVLESSNGGILSSGTTDADRFVISKLIKYVREFADEVRTSRTNDKCPAGLGTFG